MTPIDLDGAIERSLDGLMNNRLALLAGAGLSMAAPSNLPSAAAIAAEAKQEYDARYAGHRPPLSPQIEEQAEFFFGRGELSIYLNEYIDLDAFAGKPNEGHLAIADLLLSRAFQTVVTTNVDILIEGAGLQVFGHVFAAIDGHEAAAVPAEAKPLLKIHGCWHKDRNNTVWCESQLGAPPVNERVQRSAVWLQNNLVNKDLVVLGYSTDWDYLNEVIDQTMGTIAPSSVIIVNPAPPAAFTAAAPDLTALANRAQNGSFYVQVSGSEYLDRLRLEFSRAFIRRALAQSSGEFEALTGNPPAPMTLDAPAASNEDLWQMRRDLLGCKPNKPARSPVPPHEPAVGLTILQIRAAGGVHSGSYWDVAGRLVRVLRTPNSFLHTLEGAYRWDMPPVAAPDLVVAVGAEDVFLPADLVRRSDGSIARGAGPGWMTRATFEASL